MNFIYLFWHHTDFLTRLLIDWESCPFKTQLSWKLLFAPNHRYKTCWQYTWNRFSFFIFLTSLPVLNGSFPSFKCVAGLKCRIMFIKKKSEMKWNDITWNILGSKSKKCFPFLPLLLWIMQNYSDQEYAFKAIFRSLRLCWAWCHILAGSLQKPLLKVQWFHASPYLFSFILMLVFVCVRVCGVCVLTECIKNKGWRISVGLWFEGAWVGWGRQVRGQKVHPTLESPGRPQGSNSQGAPRWQKMIMLTWQL